jgi:signal transduction histidine kinase
LFLWSSSASTLPPIAALYRRRILPSFLLLIATLCLGLAFTLAIRQMSALASDQGVQAEILASRVEESVKTLSLQLSVLHSSVSTARTKSEIEAQLRRALATLPLTSSVEAVLEHGFTQGALGVDGMNWRNSTPGAALAAAPPTGFSIDTVARSNTADVSFTFRALRNYSTWLKGTLSGARLSEAVLEYGAHNGASVYLIDAKERLVAHPNPIRVLRAEHEPRRPSAWTRALRASAPNTKLTTDNKNTMWLTSYAEVKGVPWRIVVERPAVRSVASLTDLMWLLLAALGLTTLLSYFASAQLAKLLSKPVLQLKDFADALSSGKRTKFDVTAEGAEFHELATTLSAMSATIWENYRFLDQRVAEKTHELASANEALQVANRHKSNFLAHMSHELRTPLNAVIGFSEMLNAQYFGALNAKQAEYVRDINTSGQHLLSLINDVLDLAKIEAGRSELIAAEVSVNGLVEACASLISERCATKCQHLSATVEPATLIWHLDERKAKQCLLNLLSNAHKFTPANGRIDVSARVINGVLVIAVADTGIGIPASAFPHLFEEFYQVEESSFESKLREGTGLGLALTKRLVELHGGSVHVESEPQKGSVFTLRFPKDYA